ncbi:FHA domain-containing protein [Bdellovibrionota bacterium FG-1]
MYKLTVVAGPSRGTSFAVQEGETSIGRQAGSTVVLPSAKVSKRHCVLVMSQGELTVEDRGSSNGTFVNGVLAKSKKLRTGDRISVGEYVLEVSQPPSRPPRVAPALNELGDLLQFPVKPGATGAIPTSMNPLGAAPGILEAPAPKDLKGRLLWTFEHHLMPIFYNLNLRHEWRVLCVAALSVFAIGNLVVSVYPLLEQNRTHLVKEIGRRASFMARQIAEHNAGFLASRMETKTEIGTAESAEGVRVAVLTDLDGRVLAPGSKLNQYVNAGPEGAFSTRARDLFRNGRENGLVREADDLVIAVEPVRILSQQAGRNVTVGMAIVSIDTSLSTPDLGEMGMTYSETLVLTGLLGGVILLILYKLTLKPLTQLNEDMDKALKGEMGQVTHEFKFEELNPLWDIINSALQRIPQGGGGGDGLLGGMGGNAQQSVEDFVVAFRMLGGVSKLGLLVCDSDRNIIYINTLFEDMSGIRSDHALGQPIAAVARDQSIGPFFNDIFDRASGGEAAEDYDFSGVTYQCRAVAVGSPARCYVFAAARTEG